MVRDSLVKLMMIMLKLCDFLILRFIYSTIRLFFINGESHKAIYSFSFFGHPSLPPLILDLPNTIAPLFVLFILLQLPLLTLLARFLSLLLPLLRLPLHVSRVLIINRRPHLVVRDYLPEHL